ncbi:MAG: DUF2130 domain-containing protein [Nitrospira sp.]|nr:DUF2130 domain-containing protein [Nitrospira sp.]MDD9860316.1 DUF2130 domain-containing protein [Nitrospira sp.]
MNEPTITCPHCKVEFKLTDSLAAPIIESTRREFEQRQARKDADFAKRENALHEREVALARAKETVDEQVANTLKTERAAIAAEEERRVRRSMSDDLEKQKKEIADLGSILKQRDEKLAEAQRSQADVLRKERELDEARREVDLTIEKRVREERTAVRDRAKKEAEESLHLTMKEKDQTIASMQTQLGDLNRKFETERAAIVAEEEKRARRAMSDDLEKQKKEIAELGSILKQRDEKLAEAQRSQADFLRKERELDEARREVALTIEKRVREEQTAVRDRAKKEAEESLHLKMREKDETIASMQTRIGDLNRRLEQGSQQLQGEVQELELEEVLRTGFPRDTIRRVPKGEHGGDIVQGVFSPSGRACGTILWESKRTRHWSDGWLAKLRGDQRMAGAELAVIVSQALPKNVETFDRIDDVCVTHPGVVLPVATMLRHMLIEIATARQSSEGQQTKMEMVYQYLTGPQFRQRVQAIVEAFSSMRDELEKERKVLTRQWAKREMQINQVVQATAGMCGDLDGITGKPLHEIEGLEWQALNPPPGTVDESE